MGDPDIPGFGDVLREARKAKGRSTGEIAATTRIQVRYIEALEAESWQGVPGGVIGRGFVRVLAKELGGPSTEWVAAYRVARGENDAEPVHILPEADWKVDLRGGGPRLSPLLVTVLVLVGCAFGVWIWSPWAVGNPPAGPVVSSPTANSGREAASPTPVVSIPVAEAPEPPLPPVATAHEAPVEPAPAPTAEPSPGARLGIRAVERTWIRVIADGGKARSRVLGPGEQVSYTADEGFEVKFGNAGGVRLTWNDEALKVPGKMGQVTEINLPADLVTLRP